WKKVNRFAERALQYVEKEHRYQLLYKDLATNPEYELKKLCNFIGVDYSPQCLDFRQSNHHILGNTKMRLGSNSSIYYDEKWRRSLSSEQLKLFDRLAGKMNRKYGYF
ncbi:MAG: sulfotransferase domain-containing protein, partial [Desulfobacterales bacterium]|nr:sulfotransferase domain-containing protein [Nanoarchaeota archaeon]MCG2778270.1 sulfotransferase domain-containing protein [Desulfobacterales bacterium]